MKILTAALLLLLSQYCFATRGWYFSATGSDAGLGTIGSPYKTSTKFNSLFPTIAPGDSIVFKRGDTFPGFFIIGRSGSSLLPIIITAYGTGANPKISGLETISSWTNLGGNIWESNVVAAKAAVDIVTVSGEQKAPARYPNTGYFTYQSSTTNTYVSSSLTGMPSFTGGEVVARKERWIMDRQAITSNSGTTLNVATTVSRYAGKNGAGLFVQKHLNCLDVQGEWVFVSSSGKLRMYSTSTPATTKICVTDTLLRAANKNNIIIDGIDFEGAGYDAIDISVCTNVKIKNCVVRNAGQYGFYVYASPDIVIDNCQLYDVLGLAIKVRNSGYTNSTVTRNTVNRSGWIPGLGWHLPTYLDEDDSYSGMVINANSSLIQNNTLDSVGYKGIAFGGNNVLIEKNFITNYCMTKDDGGAIYTWSNDGNTVSTNRVIRNNIIEHSIGAAAGNAASPANSPESMGIYMDGAAMNVDIYNNSIAYGSTGDAGAFFNNTYNINFRNNTIYQQDEGIHFNRLPGDTDLVRTMIVTNNIVYPNVSNLFYWNGMLNVPVVVTIQQDMRNMFTRIDSNYYRNTVSSPFDWFYHLTNGGTFVNPVSQNLAQWQTTIADEANSIALPTSSVRYYRNPTDNVVQVTFTDSIFQEADGTLDTGAVNIPRYGSKLLFFVGKINTPPVVDAGADQAITLPIISVPVTGTATDAGGSISSRLWSQLSGPATVSFTAATSNSTVINGLTVAGNYTIQFSATDNGGATSSDFMQVLVNPAIPPANLPPSVNAGTDVTITLPITITSFTASASDPDGTISTYAWTFLSGPTTPSITSASTATTGITGLTLAGDYFFLITVTDNLGATATDAIKVTVNALTTSPPIPNAGADASFPLPTTAVTLGGSGTDGTNCPILTNTWELISNPVGSFPIITTPGSYTSTFTNLLVPGTYVLGLKLTSACSVPVYDYINIVVLPVSPPSTNCNCFPTYTKFEN